MTEHNIVRGAKKYSCVFFVLNSHKLISTVFFTLENISIVHGKDFVAILFKTLNMILRELLLKFVVLDVSWCPRQVRNHWSTLNKFVEVDTTFWCGRYF